MRRPDDAPLATLLSTLVELADSDHLSIRQVQAIVNIVDPRVLSHLDEGMTVRQGLTHIRGAHDGR